jgi:hypothetical protein
MEWDQQHGCLVNGPGAQAERDLQELGRRVAWWLDVQAHPISEADLG